MSLNITTLYLGWAVQCVLTGVSPVFILWGSIFSILPAAETSNLQLQPGALVVLLPSVFSFKVNHRGLESWRQVGSWSKCLLPRRIFISSQGSGVLIWFHLSTEVLPDLVFTPFCFGSCDRHFFSAVTPQQSEQPAASCVLLFLVFPPKAVLCLK